MAGLNEGDANRMTNQQLITDHIDQYKALYTKQHGVNPTSWWSFTKWLADSTGAHTFTPEDVELAKSLLN